MIRCLWGLLGFACLLFLSLASPTSDEIQKVAGTACAARYLNITGEIPNGDFQFFSFLRKSAMATNDLGSYKECLATTNASYYLATVDVEYVKIFFGLCVPKECELTLYPSVNEFMAKTLYEQAPPGTVPPLTAANVQIYESQKENKRVAEWGPLAIVSVLIVCALALCVLLGTSYQLCDSFNQRKRQQEREKLVESSALQPVELDEPQPKRGGCLKYFDVISNCKQLMKPTTQGEGDRTDVLNGVRVCAMGHVVLAHVFFFFTHGSIVNLADVFTIIKEEWFAVITVGTYAVDVFFFLSGFLATYIILARMHKRRGKGEGCFAAVLHRWIRLFPLYAFVMLFTTGILPLLANGPIYFLYVDSELSQCENSWWAHFLYVNNFWGLLPHDMDFCIGWTWYLANDFQFFLLAALLVPLYYHHPRLSFLILTIVQTLCFIVTTVMAAIQDYNLSIVTMRETYFEWNYIKPWSRLFPFFVGICGSFAYFQYRFETAHIPLFNSINNKVLASQRTRVALYILGISIIFFLTCMHGWLNSDFDDWGSFANVLMVVYSRGLFVFGLLCLLYPALLGHAGLMYRLLAHKIWTPFAKVTYAMYLIHPVFMDIAAHNSEGEDYLSAAMCFFLFIPYVTVVLLTGIVLHLLVEGPFLRLDNAYVRPLFSKRKNSQ